MIEYRLLREALLENNKEIYSDIEKLLAQYKNCTDEKKKRILHINIIQKNMFLVKKIAGNISLPSGVPMEDLVQVGSIGLIKAIEFFDVEKNVKFKTYATHFIKGEIKHYLRDKSYMIKAPRELQELVFKISTAIRDLKAQGFDEPAEEQISELVNIDIKKIHEVMQLEFCKSILSLDQTHSSFGDDDMTLIDKIPSGDYQEFLISRENTIMLKSAIERLPYDLKEIIELHYFQDLNQREISDKLKISQMQVSRKIRKAINRLYKIISRDDKNFK